MNVQLRALALPAQTPTADQPGIPADEYARACAALYAAAESDWVVVYGDREHAANLSYLCGFDPRFERPMKSESVCPAGILDQNELDGGG